MLGFPYSYLFCVFSLRTHISTSIPSITLQNIFVRIRANACYSTCLDPWTDFRNTLSEKSQTRNMLSCQIISIMV